VSTQRLDVFDLSLGRVGVQQIQSFGDQRTATAASALIEADRLLDGRVYALPVAWPGPGSRTPMEPQHGRPVRVTCHLEVELVPVCHREMAVTNQVDIGHNVTLPDHRVDLRFRA
jgi:hypothetical protein